MSDDTRNDVSRAQAEEAVRTLLRWSGDDPTREGLLDTPKLMLDFDGITSKLRTAAEASVRSRTKGLNKPSIIAASSSNRNHMIEVCLPPT